MRLPKEIASNFRIDEIGGVTDIIHLKNTWRIGKIITKVVTNVRITIICCSL